MFLCYYATHEEQSINLLLKQGVNYTNFFFFLLVRITQNDIVMVHIGNIFNPTCNFSKNGIGNIGNNNTDCCCLLTC